MANIDKNELHNILRLILHNGLTEAKVKNSKKLLSLNSNDNSDKKGSIAGFRSKDAMREAKGFPISSYEALFENDNKLTHWTPNEFSWLGYTNGQQQLKGHGERNLNQINTFVVDIDFKNSIERDKKQDEVFESLLLGYVILPTLILKTSKGYQVYYVLNNPAFISKKGARYPVLEVAKIISNNIKAAIKNKLGQVDIGCNNFGIFRIPRQDNVLYFEPEMIVSFSTLLNWSKKYYQNNKPKLQVVKVNKVAFDKQINQPWFDWLLHKTDIKPDMGIGRHNTVLTLALACYSSHMSENDCYNLLDEFNTYLQVSLKQRDLDRCVKDAYSGAYKGASAIYINELIETWATPAERHQLKQVKNKSWYKFAKKREDRKYSHSSEWKQDLIKLLNKKANNGEAVVISTRNIQKELGISPSSLSRVLKALKNKNQLIVKDTGFNKTKSYMTLFTLVRHLQAKKEQYRNDVLNNITEENVRELDHLEQQLKLLKGNDNLSAIVDIGTKNTG